MRAELELHALSLLELSFPEVLEFTRKACITWCKISDFQNMLQRHAQAGMVKLFLRKIDLAFAVAISRLETGTLEEIKNLHY